MKPAPYIIAWWTVLILIIICLVSGPTDTLDLQLHDTYIIAHISSYCLVFTVIAGVFGSLYWMIRKQDYPYPIAITHIAITSLVLIFMMSYIAYLANYQGSIAHVSIINFTFLLLFIVFQLFFLVLFFAKAIMKK